MYGDSARTTHRTRKTNHQPKFPAKSQGVTPRHGILVTPVAVSPGQGSNQSGTLADAGKRNGYTIETNGSGRGGFVLKSEKLCNDGSKHGQSNGRSNPC